MALFTVAEARAFDQGQLVSVTNFPDVAIQQAATDAKEFLEDVCHVNFEPTVHTDYINGDGSDWMFLSWPKVTSVTSITVDGAALTSEEIDTDDFDLGLAIDADLGILTRRCGYFAKGWRNIVVVYEAGWAAVPAIIKRAALWVALGNLVSTNTPYDADSFTAGDASYSFSRADGYNGNWHKNPEVAKAIRMYGDAPWIA